MSIPRLLALTALVVALLATSAPARAQDDALAAVTAKQYVVVDAETGEVYAEKRGDGRAGMASVTKMFTLMEAVQRSPLDLEVTVLETDMFGSDSTKMTGLVPGAVFTLEDLLYGMMLESGNDAAYAIARAVGAMPGDTEAESVARFVGWMNERAASLGLVDTQLKNPHGLSEPGHYTTPRDLAAFLMYGLEVDEFMRVLVARSYVLSNGVEIFSINRAPQFIPDHYGGKTGYDNATGYCLAEVGERDGRRMIAVTFDGLAPDVWYQDQALLFDFAFERKRERLASGEPMLTDRVAFLAPGSVAVAEDPVNAPTDAEVAQTDPAAEVAQTVPEPAAPTAVAVVPTPIRIESVPEPAVVVRDERSITGDWVLPVAVVVGLLGTVTIRQLFPAGTTDARKRPVDTPAEAS